MMVDLEFHMVSGSRRATVDILDTDWNVCRRCQCGDVNVVTLTTHRLHVLCTPHTSHHQQSTRHLKAVRHRSGYKQLIAAMLLDTYLR